MLQVTNYKKHGQYYKFDVTKAFIIISYKL